MSTFWSAFVIVLTVVNVAACVWLLWWTSRRRSGEPETTGHVWDGDLTEYNNPLPRWWLILFYLTVVFAAIYLVVYPGLGAYRGLLGWSQQRAYQQEVASAEARYGDIYAAWEDLDLRALAGTPAAMRAAANLYASYCAACHGSDARGAPGFPDLTDDAWLYGGEPEAIYQSILDGRHGVMPALGPALGRQGIEEVAAYVMSLSGRTAPADWVEAGGAKFQTYCASCHGPAGKGNQALGAPDLTDDDWLYRGTLDAVRSTIENGRSNQMPAHRDLLGMARVRLLAAWVWQHSGGRDGGAAD